MKLCFTCLIVCCVCVTRAQSEISKDTMLMNVISYIPDEWSVTVEDSILRFELSEPMYMANGNWINAPQEVWELKSDSAWIVDNGTSHKAYIDYHIKEITKEEDVQEGYRSNYYALRFKNYSEGLQMYEPQYNAMWPKETESVMYLIPRLLAEHLIKIKE